MCTLYAWCINVYVNLYIKKKSSYQCRFFLNKSFVQALTDKGKKITARAIDIANSKFVKFQLFFVAFNPAFIVILDIKQKVQINHFIICICILLMVYFFCTPPDGHSENLQCVTHLININQKRANKKKKERINVHSKWYF